MSEHNEAMKLADACKHGWLENVDPDKCSLDDLLALLRKQAERIAELEARVHTCGPTCSKAGCINRRLTAERDTLRAEVERLNLAEEGAAQAFGDVVQQKRDLEGEVKRRQSLLDGAYASIRNYSDTARKEAT